MRRVAFSTSVLLGTLAFSAVTCGHAAAQVSKPGEYSGYSEAEYDGYQRTSQYVAVRDGTKIAIDIYRPTLKGVLVTRKLPVVWMNTPYNRRHSTGDSNPAPALSKHGYVVVVADMRGTNASFGKAVADSSAASAGNRNEWMPWAYWDAYDITEWIASQAWSDSKVGMIGCSAVGHSQWQAAATAPPHLKAIFPMDAPSEYYPWNGISETSAESAAAPTSAAAHPGPPGPGAFPVDDDPEGKLQQAAVAEHKNNVSPGFMPFRDSVSPGLAVAGLPDFRYHLQVNTFTHFADLNKARIPAYETTNFGEDERVKLGVMVKLRNLSFPVRLIVGPGPHCNWSTYEKENPNNSFNIEAEQLRWYDYWLKGIQNGVLDAPPIYYYTYNEPQDRAWKFAWQWPLPNAKDVKYYFGPGDSSPHEGGDHGSLSTTAPSGGKDLYTVDYKVTAANENEKGMTYTTPPLTGDMTSSGHPVIHLWISSTATDGDFLAHLADVGPDGTVTALPGTDDGQLRASMRVLNTPPYDNLGLPYHRSFAQDKQPLTPNQAVELVFDMAPISWVFKSGHRVRLLLSCVQNDRHGGPTATPVLSPPPVVSVYHDAAHASYIAMPVSAPIVALVKLTSGKGKIMATVSLPDSMDRRYLADVKTGSVRCNNAPAVSATVQGSTLLVACGAGTLAAPLTVAGQFGQKFFYGDLMSFAGTANATK